MNKLEKAIEAWLLSSDPDRRVVFRFDWDDPNIPKTAVAVKVFFEDAHGNLTLNNAFTRDES